MAGYPEDLDESSAPPPEPPPQRPRPSRPPPPRPRPSRPPPPPNPTPNPRLFKLRYFYNYTCFCSRPFQKSSRPQIPPEAPEIVNKNPWTSAPSESEIEPQSCHSEEEEDIYAQFVMMGMMGRSQKFIQIVTIICIRIWSAERVCPDVTRRKFKGDNYLV